MMPDAMLPAMPRALAVAWGVMRVAAATAAVAPIAPSTAVGWNPAACTPFCTASPSRHISSWPTAIPRKASLPLRRCASATASTAGTMTEPGCTGQPSKVLSKSSPWAAVPLIIAADPASRVTCDPMTVQGPSAVQDSSSAET